MDLVEQGPCEGARKCGLRFVDHRRRGTEDGIGVERVDNVADGVSMDLIDGIFVVSLGHDARFEEWRDDARIPHIDCMFPSQQRLTTGTRYS